MAKERNILSEKSTAEVDLEVTAIVDLVRPKSHSEDAQVAISRRADREVTDREVGPGTEI